MKSKIQSLIDRKIFKPTKLPKNKYAIGCKWAHKVKRSVYGTADWYKARLVAKGFSQECQVNYEEVFAPVVKYTTMHMIIAITANKQQTWQMDVKTAFYMVIQMKKSICPYQKVMMIMGTLIV